MKDTSADTDAGLKISPLQFSRGERLVLDLPALDLCERRIGIVGRNGSGKTTFLRVAAGLQTPDEGEVSIAGVRVLTDREAAISTVGILFQNPDHQIIFPTVEEEIGFGLKQLGQNKEDVKAGVLAALTRFGKETWAERPVHVLSQGQRHLVCLMAVLAMKPRVVLLDEPFAGLDIPTTRALNAAIEGLGEQVIMITHDPERLNGFDRVLWLEAGKLVKDGPAYDVLIAYTKAMSGEGRDDLSDL